MEIIMWKEFILSLILFDPHPEPKHPLNKDPELLDRVEAAFVSAGEKYNLAPWLLLYWGWRESRLRPEAVGKYPNPEGKILNERGICQAHGKAKWICEKNGLDLATVEGGAECLALLLDMGRRYCGDLQGAGRWYASGSCHKAREKMAKRFRAADRRSCKFRGGTWSKKEKKCQSPKN